MSYINKELDSEFDFFDKININLNHFILELNFHKKNSLIKSKFAKNFSTKDYFNCYSNKNAILLFESLDKIDNFYSNIYAQNSPNNLTSKKDKYILELSNIILLFNLVSRNQKIIKKNINNAKTYLSNFYLENHINKDSQKKLNDYIDNLINTKKKRKKNLSSLITHTNIFNRAVRHKTMKTENPNILTLNKNTDEKVFDFNEKLMKVNPINLNTINNNIKLTNEEKLINDLTTPKFPNKIIDDDKNNNDSKVNDNSGLNKNSIMKQGSIQSYYTLASKAAFIIQDENNNQKEEQEKEKEEKIIIEDKPKITIINDNKNDYIPHLIYSKSNFSENKKVKNNQNLEQKFCYTQGNPRKQIFSSINLKTSMEKDMLKNFLIYINNLYKQGNINNEEKLKLKQLIISRSEKIEKIYNIFYKVDKNKLLNELKKLII